MKYVRRGLLMILILALVMPAPVVLAESENVVVENTTDTTKLVDEEKDSSDNSVNTTIQTDTKEPQQSAAEKLTENENIEVVGTETITLKENVDNNATADQNLDAETADDVDVPKKLIITKIRTDGAGKNEFVEIYNPNDTEVNLAGWQLKFISTSSADPKDPKDPKILKSFSSDDIIKPNGFFVLAHNLYFDKIGADARFEVRNVSNGEYTATHILFVNGTVELTNSAGETADKVGWKKSKGDVKNFEGSPVNNENGWTLQRCVLANGAVRDTDNNAADFKVYLQDGGGELIGLRQFVGCPAEEAPAIDPEPDPGTPNPPGDTPPVATNKCKGLRLNEIFANTKNKEQFIEVRNSSETVLDLKGCRLVTDKHKATDFYEFGELELVAGDVLAVRASEMKLKLTKQAEGWVSVRDAAGEKIEEVKYEGLAEDASWSLIDGKWLQTFTVTEDATNRYAKWRACEVGYFRNELTGRCNKIPVEIAPEPCGPGQFRNPETGRCKKIEVAKTPTPCKEGYYRSEETGRCRSIAAAAAKTLKPCADDEFRNPLTNRCKKIAADSDVLKDCHEGYERNPVTNRCRKIRTASAPVVGFAPENVQQVAGATWGWWVLGGVSLLAIGHGTWQWRWEISRAARKVAGIFASRGK